MDGKEPRQNAWNSCSCKAPNKAGRDGLSFLLEIMGAHCHFNLKGIYEDESDSANSI